MNNFYGQKTGLFTDLYQLTMAYGYWKAGKDRNEAVFNLFFRACPFGGAYALACGLETAVSYIDDFGFSENDLAYLSGLKDNAGWKLFEDEFLDYLADLSLECDVHAMPEGCLAFPLEPLIRVKGPLLHCQLLETMLLNIINFQTLIATKAARICSVADGPVMEFGMRRAQGNDGALSASRAAYIGGCAGTSHVHAGKLFDIPVKGTHAHSWVMAFDTEKEAFESYTEAMSENSILLVDTYETVEGVITAAEVGRQMKARGKKLAGIRLDSGDFDELSRKSRKILDENGLNDCMIIASGNLDEYLIEELVNAGAPIDVWGVGTRLVTGYNEGALDGVYKMTALKNEKGQWIEKMKLSDDPSKSTFGGIHQVRRFKRSGKICGDIIYDERIGCAGKSMMTNGGEEYNSVDFEDLLVPIFINGRKVYKNPLIDQIRDVACKNLEVLPDSCRMLKDPNLYPLYWEENLAQINWNIAENIIKKIRKNDNAKSSYNNRSPE